MKLSPREKATVLAALRYWQDQVGGTSCVPSGLSGHFTEHVPLSDQEVDVLCEKINLGEPEG